MDLSQVELGLKNAKLDAQLDAETLDTEVIFEVYTFLRPILSYCPRNSPEI